MGGAGNESVDSATTTWQNGTGGMEGSMDTNTSSTTAPAWADR